MGFFIRIVDVVEDVLLRGDGQGRRQVAQTSVGRSRSGVGSGGILLNFPGATSPDGVLVQRESLFVGAGAHPLVKFSASREVQHPAVVLVPRKESGGKKKRA